MKVKAYLQVNGVVEEIRRFEVLHHQLMRPSYERLFDSIEELFKVSSFKLCYKDNDGDLVVFSSQEELDQGVKFLKDDTFYVYVICSAKITQGPPVNPAGPDQVNRATSKKIKNGTPILGGPLRKY